MSVCSAAFGSALWLSAGVASAEPDPAPPEPAAAPAAASAPPPAAEAAPAPAADSAPAPVAEASPAPDATPVADTKPKPPPYSLPWQLRPVAPATVIRSDTAFAFDKPAGKSGSAIVSTLLGSYKIVPDFAVIARLGFVSNSPPAPANSATTFANPVLGGLYGIKLDPSVKLGLFMAVALPLGSGSTPGSDKAKANAIAMQARSAFDNSMFAADYLAIFPGIDIAYIAHGFTLQAEATLFELVKAKGPSTIDRNNTNFTTGLHAGYFIIPQLSIGAEIRHQRWLSTPAAVKNDATHSIRDTTTVAIGPRLHFKLSDSVWFRPGIAFAAPLDDPMKKAEYKIVQLDLPVSF